MITETIIDGVIKIFNNKVFLRSFGWFPYGANPRYEWIEVPVGMLNDDTKKQVKPYLN